MKKSEFVKEVAAQCGISQAAANTAISAVFDTIKKVVNEGNEVAIRNFGTFKLKSLPERNGINPKTGQAITIPAHKVAAFKASENFLNEK